MSKDLAKREETGLVPASFEEEANVGMEEADSESFAIPFLQVLQKLSPQLDSDDGKYIEGAKAGDIVQTVTNEIFPGKEGVLLVPVHFQRVFTEWVPRDQGGGFRGVRSPSDPLVASGVRDDSGKLQLDSGNLLVDTRYHFCLLLGPEGPQPVLLGLTSSQIKKSKQWLTVMRSLKMRGQSGRPFTPPTYSHVYKAVTVPESNSKGSWHGLKITKERVLNLEEEEDQYIYVAAKEFREQVASGQARVEHIEEEEVNEDTEF